MRLVVVSSPRSGSSWVRQIRALSYGLEQVAVHVGEELPTPLPPRVVVQAHWDRAAGPVEGWEWQGVQVLTVARHPIDTLLSMLHVSRFEPAVARWLRGEYLAGLATPARRATPSPGSSSDPGPVVSSASRPVVDCTQHRADPVRGPGRDPVGTLASVERHLCQPRSTPLATAVAALPFRLFRDRPNHHGWQGRPGLWRCLVVPDLAERTRRAPEQAFELLGWTATPIPA